MENTKKQKSAIAERKRTRDHFMDNNVLIDLMNTPNDTKISSELKKLKTDDSGCKKNCVPIGIEPHTVQKSPLRSIRLSSQDPDEILFGEFSSQDFLDSFSDDSSLLVTKSHSLDLAKPQHCTVGNITNLNCKKILQLKSTKNEETAICHVEGFWLNNEIRIKNTVCVQASKIPEINEWVVNNRTGWLVYEPDVLISCTAVVASMFCKRKSVLSERYKGFDTTNRVMLIGVIVHTLLQTVLRLNLKTKTQMQAQIDDILQSPVQVKRMYECGASIDEMRNEVSLFIPKIIDFLDQYVSGNSRTRSNDENWVGKIEKIDDIEENLWCPELGIKGKIDVSVRTDRGPMPVELKTGRASVSLEHRGQVILYIMMMNKFQLKVSSGLLLYLRDGVVREIPMSENEKRDLIILRNELAHYFTRNTRKIDDDFKPPELPEPINHRSACKNCEYKTICTAFLKAENYDLSCNKALNEIRNELTSHLTEGHLKYFMKWSSLVALESEVKTGFKAMKEIYTVDPEDREKKGRCISSLKVIEVIAENNGVFGHIFRKSHLNSSRNFISCGISEGNYVVVSTTARPAVATGYVIDLSPTTITITLDRNLQSKYRYHTFHIDTYDFFSTQSYNLASLSLLLDNTDRASILRSLIIDKNSPVFLKKLPSKVAVDGAPILKKLNRVQQRAVLKAMSAQNYLLIEGMPGTGKTATIVALIQLLVKLGKSVLLTSHTHLAVDNVCNRLKKSEVDFIRLGAEARIDCNLKAHSEFAIMQHCKTPEEMERIFNKYQVVAVTCLGSGHTVLSKRTFDVCIVDESTQALQISLLRPLFASKTFVLIGDPHQLPPVIRNKESLAAGMSESLFVRLQNPEATITLNLNYRMNQTITDLANAVTYEGKLLIGNDEVASARLRIPKIELINKEWVVKALDTSLEASIQIIDTGPVWQKPEDIEKLMKKINHNSETREEPSNCFNPHEASIVLALVTNLVRGGVPESEIGVIATFKAQVVLISNLINNTNVIVSTVDQFQGQDKSVIIYSCTKSKDETKMSSDMQNELLEDKRRLTVAITRAKHKFILIGDLSTIQRYTAIKTLLDAVDSQRIIRIESDLLL